MASSPFVRIVPAIRTIPGVEVFDYRIPEGLDLRIGDVIRVPFRRQQLPGMILSFETSSAFADKAVTLPLSTSPLLRLGEIPPKLLEFTAHRTLTSRPSVLLSWLRDLPKKAVPLPLDALHSLSLDSISTSQTSVRLLSDRLQGPGGLFETARAARGRVLILTPWQARAERIASELGGQAYHADLTPTAAWKLLQSFNTTPSNEACILVSTRVGAWLSSVAETILVDEPENDDHKQDELSPRFDARWMASLMPTLRDNVFVCAFSTTPRLLRPDPVSVPEIEITPTLDPWGKGKYSQIPILSGNSEVALQEAVSEGRPAIIIHPVEGARSRICCRDCGWTANCSSCGFILSLSPLGAICRKCGRKSPVPTTCANCGGFDLTRGRLGRDAVQLQCDQIFGAGKVQVVSSLGFDTCFIQRGEVVISDLGSLAGGAEDIRRKERLAIHFRRVAAACAASNAHLTIHGQDELLEEASSWIHSDQLFKLWQQEFADRKLFAYPPARRLIKVLIDGSESDCRALQNKLADALGRQWHIRGSFPIAYRANTRGSRFVLHLIPPEGLSEASILDCLTPFQGQAIFDLDPVAFFC